MSGLWFSSKTSETSRSVLVLSFRRATTRAPSTSAGSRLGPSGVHSSSSSPVLSSRWTRSRPLAAARVEVLFLHEQGEVFSGLQAHWISRRVNFLNRRTLDRTIRNVLALIKDFRMTSEGHPGFFRLFWLFTLEIVSHAHLQRSLLRPTVDPI